MSILLVAAMIVASFAGAFCGAAVTELLLERFHQNKIGAFEEEPTNVYEFGRHRRDDSPA